MGHGRMTQQQSDLLAALKALVAYGRREFAWDLEVEAEELLARADAAIADAEDME